MERSKEIVLIQNRIVEHRNDINEHFLNLSIKSGKEVREEWLPKIIEETGLGNLIKSFKCDEENNSPHEVALGVLVVQLELNSELGNFVCAIVLGTDENVETLHEQLFAGLEQD